MNPQEFVEWEKAAPGIDFKVQYVDLAGGDLPAGLLLSQILFWCLPSKTGKSKLTVKREGRLWIAKSKVEWYRETRLKRDAFSRAVQVLEARDLSLARTFHFHNRPRLHIALDLVVFLPAMAHVLAAQEAAKGTD